MKLWTCRCRRVVINRARDLFLSSCRRSSTELRTRPKVERMGRSLFADTGIMSVEPLRVQSSLRPSTPTEFTMLLCYDPIAQVDLHSKGQPFIENSSALAELKSVTYVYGHVTHVSGITPRKRRHSKGGCPFGQPLAITFRLQLIAVPCLLMLLSTSGSSRRRDLCHRPSFEPRVPASPTKLLSLIRHVALRFIDRHKLISRFAAMPKNSSAVSVLDASASTHVCGCPARTARPIRFVVTTSCHVCEIRFANLFHGVYVVVVPGHVVAYEYIHSVVERILTDVYPREASQDSTFALSRSISRV